MLYHQVVRRKNVNLMSIEELQSEVEQTWYRHLELRNEIYEIDMGPSNVLDVYVSSQKTVRRPRMSKRELSQLLKSNFDYHMKLRKKYFHLMNVQFPKQKMYM